MPVNQQIIETLKRSLKKEANIDKLIKKLVAARQIDLLIDIGPEGTDYSEVTLLMHYARRNNLSKVRELLGGKNSADPTIINKHTFHALMLVVLEMDSNNQTTFFPVIDELLKYKPRQQLLVNTRLGSVFLFAIFQQYDQLIEKFLPFVTLDLLFLASPMSKSIPLHIAVEKNASALVKNLLKIEPEKQVLLENAHGLLPLFIALQQKNFPLAQYLLQYTPEKQLLHKTSDSHTIFDFVVVSKNIELLKWLNEVYPVEFKAMTLASSRALDIAMSVNALPMIDFYLKSSDVAKKSLLKGDEKGRIPLSNVLLLDQIDQMKLLLQHYPKEQIESVDDEGYTILHICAILRAYKSLKYLTEFMPKIGIDISSFLLKTSSIGAIPISFLIGSTQSNDSLTYEERKALELMIELNPKQLEYVATVEVHVETALEFAIGQGKTAIVRLLLEKGPIAQLRIKHPPKNLSPLAVALSFNNFEIAEIILNFLTDEDLFRCNITSCSPLHHAIAVKMNKFATALMNHKFSALLFESDMSEGNPINPFTPLHLALYCSNFWATKELIKRGANINAKGNEGWAPLHMACASGALATIQLLIDAQAEIGIRNNYGDTPLHLAAGNGNLGAMRLLEPYYKNWEVVNNNQLTPLLMACLFDQEEVIEYLVEKGANINATFVIISAEGVETHSTPLLIAIQNMNLNLALFLIKKGAEKNPVVVKHNNRAYPLLEHLELMYMQNNSFYNKLRTILPDLPKPKVVQGSYSSIPMQEKEIFSSRNYLLQLGYSKEIIDGFEEANKINKLLLSQDKANFFPTKTRQDKMATSINWFNGKISSENVHIFRIESPNNIDFYCYLDETTLVSQDCDPSKLYKKRFKLSPYNFKKLESDKGKYRELVEIDQIKKEIVYTHELKLNGLDRVLLFPILCDDNKVPLYIGLRYISGGLHSLGKIHALQDSIKAEKELLKVNLPPSNNQKSNTL